MTSAEVENSAAGMPPANSKRLIVCCDGTWNDSISTDSPLTNVARISRCIPGLSDKGVVQVVSYWSGVGSGTSKGGNVIDGMTGRGISANIRDAYTFICHNYLHDYHNHDEIVLIGFSRGAFTARSIASFITDVGLLEKAGLSYMLKLYRLWANQLSKKQQKDDMFPGIPPSTPQIRMRRLCKMLEEMKLLRIGVKINVCAVWDTVGSLGLPMPGPIPQRVSKKLAFVNSTLVETIDVAIQALALNERRKHFQPTVWKSNSRTKLRQCWFLGAHSDVGGGNPDTGLANLALVWMIVQLSDFVYFDGETLRHLASHRRIGTREVTATRSMEFSVNVSALGIPGSDISVKHESSLSVGRYHRATGKIKNSVKGPFLLAGTIPRKPGQYLMNTRGLYRNSKNHPVPTEETMHWTVRVLLGLRLRQCPALQKYSTKLEGESRIVWTLHSSRQKRETAIKLNEDEFSRLERDMLESWMMAEGYTEQVSGAVIGVSVGTVKLYLSDLLIPRMGELDKPTIHFPPRDEPVSVSLEVPVG